VRVSKDIQQEMDLAEMEKPEEVENGDNKGNSIKKEGKLIE